MSETKIIIPKIQVKQVKTFRLSEHDNIDKVVNEYLVEIQCKTGNPPYLDFNNPEFIAVICCESKDKIADNE